MNPKYVSNHDERGGGSEDEDCACQPENPLVDFAKLSNPFNHLVNPSHKMCLRLATLCMSISQLLS